MNKNCAIIKVQRGKTPIYPVNIVGRVEFLVCIPHERKLSFESG